MSQSRAFKSDTESVSLGKALSVSESQVSHPLGEALDYSAEFYKGSHSLSSFIISLCQVCGTLGLTGHWIQMQSLVVIPRFHSFLMLRTSGTPENHTQLSLGMSSWRA